jgi:hypothetical protein
MGNRREGEEAEREIDPKVNSEGVGGYWSSGEAEREWELAMLKDIVWKDVEGLVGWERSCLRVGRVVKIAGSV